MKFSRHRKKGQAPPKMKGSRAVMKEQYKKMSFLLDGGVVSVLSEYLAGRTSKGLILRPEGSDLAVLDAFGAAPGDLFLKGAAPSLEGAFPSPILKEAYDVTVAPCEGDWPWAVRLRGRGWIFFVLLGEEPAPEVMDEMASFAGIIHLWQGYQKTAGAEERLSRLAYMVLATKSTLASIFEPMGLDYFGAFLYDVMNESLFPARLSILLDDGSTLTLLEGDELDLPPRKGVFGQDILSPAPIKVEGAGRGLGEEVADLLAGEWTAVLPIPGGSARLFCLLQWEKMPGEEAFNFMELLGNVASKALSLARLGEERERHIGELSRRTYLLAAIHEASLKLMRETSKEDLLFKILDVFTEMGQSPQSLIVVWQPAAGGYVHLASKKDGVLEKKGTVVGFPLGILEEECPGSLSLEEARRLFNLMEVPALTSVEGFDRMDRVFPLWDGEKLTAFAAISAPLAGTDTLDEETLEILARSSSVALKKSEWQAGHLGAGKFLDLDALTSGEIERAKGEIRAEGGTPVNIKGPGGVLLDSEQERLCRLVIRSKDRTLAVAEGGSPWPHDPFPRAEGWIVETEEP